MNLQQPFVNQFSDKNDCDVVAYFGDVVRGEDTYLIREANKRRKRKNILLLLSTRGGDPNAGYRISRAFQTAYQTTTRKQPGASNSSASKVGDFSVLVDGVCKSAGTLISLGADRLIMSDNAELGPIDTQVRKQNEVGEMTSGLNPMQALQFLETQSTVLFKRHFRSLRDPKELGFSTNMAAEVSSKITIGLLNAIYQQIDPMRLAEMDRSLRIAKEYGERLKTDNVKDDAISSLLVKYPSHSFAIDRTEATGLFKAVRGPTPDEEELARRFGPLARFYLDQEDDTFVYYLSDEPPASASASPSLVGATAPASNPAPQAVPVADPVDQGGSSTQPNDAAPQDGAQDGPAQVKSDRRSSRRKGRRKRNPN